MNNQQAKELLQKYNNRTASLEERDLVDSWFLNLKSTQTPHNLSEAQIDFNTTAVWSSLQGNLSKPKRKLWPQFAAAAAILLVLFGAGLWYLGNKKVDLDTAVYANDIAPGKNGATLTLADGREILISDAVEGNIALESGVKISKTSEGEIIYEVIGDDGAIGYNTLTTTRGQQSRVRLPDGTQVFLNAESSLRYPNNFVQAKNRLVSLTGEGFFEVAKDKARPFIVNTKGQSVEVLGTHFNINAYENNRAIKTTLLEGSVLVSNLWSKSSLTLKPGQQATITHTAIEMANVEPEDAVAWKNGVMMYEGETLENIMKDVARWYDVQVVFKDQDIKRKEFFVSISRFDHISKLIKLMEKSKTVAFQIEGNNIIISKKAD